MKTLVYKHVFAPSTDEERGMITYLSETPDDPALCSTDDCVDTGSENGIELNDMLKVTRDTIILSICIDSFNIICEFYLIYCESQALGEYFLDYCLLRLRGKHGWIPFHHLIQKHSL